MSNDNIMDPTSSPIGLTKKSGVRRVNNLPMYIMLGVIVLFLIIMVMVAVDRSDKSQKDTEEKTSSSGTTTKFAEELTQDHPDGIIAATPIPAQPPELKQPLTLTKPTTSLSRPINLDRPPLPPVPVPAPDPEIQRIKRAKMQMLQQAIRAGTAVQTRAPQSSGSILPTTGGSPNRQSMLTEIDRVNQEINTNRQTDPTTAFKQHLAQIKQVIGGTASGLTGGGTAPAQQPVAVSQTTAAGYSQFDNAAAKNKDRWSLDSKVKAPSAYQLRSGFVIPATLISGINSSLPGQIVAQVSQNVYDTPSGRYLLLPQGSRLVGSYSKDVAYGQKRLLVAWQRIIFPDGKALDIGSMPGADAAGYSGFHDKVNNHYLRIFGSAFLMSGITAGITLSQDDKSSNSSNADNSQRASDALSEALGQQLGQVTVEMIRKNMNIAPTLEIRPGYRFNVIVTKDMTFSKPYQEFDY